MLGGSYDEWLARAAPQEPDETPEEWQPFAISYTSGTTGAAKGIVLSHRSRVLTCFGMASEYGCYGPDDTHLAFAPLFTAAASPSRWPPSSSAASASSCPGSTRSW